MTILFYSVSIGKLLSNPSPTFIQETLASVPLYTRDPVPPGFHTSLSFPDQVLSGDLFGWRGCWGYGWFPDRFLYYLQFSCVYRPLKLWYSAGSLVALYNGQCMMTCITKMISDRRWQRGLSYEHVFSVSQACPFSVVAWKRSRK